MENACREEDEGAGDSSAWALVAPTATIPAARSPAPAVRRIHGFTGITNFPHKEFGRTKLKRVRAGVYAGCGNARTGRRRNRPALRSVAARAADRQRRRRRTGNPHHHHGRPTRRWRDEAATDADLAGATGIGAAAGKRVPLPRLTHLDPDPVDTVSRPRAQLPGQAGLSRGRRRRPIVVLRCRCPGSGRRSESGCGEPDRGEPGENTDGCPFAEDGTASKHIAVSLRTRPGDRGHPYGRVPPTRCLPVTSRLGRHRCPLSGGRCRRRCRSR